MSTLTRPKRRRAARSLGEFVPGALGEAMAARGFAGGEIVLRWNEIAGPELGRRSVPAKLSWPRQTGGTQSKDARQPAILTVQVESAFALDLQMQIPVLIDRINRYFGWGCVGSIKLKQVPVSRNPVKRPAPPPNAEQESRLSSLVEGVEDERLADALKRLGRNVASAARR